MEEYSRIIEDTNAKQLNYEIKKDSLIGSLFDFIKTVKGDDYVFQFNQVLTTPEEAQLDQLISDHTIDPDFGKEYEIQLDVEGHILEKDIRSINYKTELNTLVSYTPEYIIHSEGVNSGLLDITNYYRGYVDENNKGTLVLSVQEVYVIDTSDVTLNNSGKPATSRIKTWSYYKRNNGVDPTKVKEKTKLYNTRRKRHEEGIRRRKNILEQLIDNVGLAGVLSGIFISEADAHEKMTTLSKDHSAAFSAWEQSSRGSLYDDVEDDSANAWLDSSVSNAINQPEPQRTIIAPIELTSVQHMMDMTMRDYFCQKLKGDIK